MKNQILFLLFSLFCFTATAQFQVSGDLSDENGEALAFASVVVLEKSDSSIHSFSLSNARGKYLVDIKDTGDYLIQYSFLGYKTESRNLKIDSENKSTVLPIVRLSQQSIALSEVQISEDRVPLKMKGDTLIYDAKAFKTKEGADVEALLEKLPGVEVDESGNITAQGKQVSKILVNGKEFFGNDPKVATKNLDANTVKSIQVLDKKSEQAEFTGIDDGNEEKTINIELKEEYSKGQFGKIYLGAGTEETYKGKLNYNHFNKKTQFSVIANANNLNEQNFSFDEYRDFSGSSGRRMNINTNLMNGLGSNQGINDNFTTGLNVSHEFSKKLEVSANYLYLSTDNLIINQINSSNFTPTETFSTEENINSSNSQDRQSLNTDVKWKPDSLTQLDYNGNFSIAQSKQQFNSNTLFNPSRRGLNETVQNSNEQEDEWSTYQKFNLQRKFKKEGRNAALNYDFYYNSVDNELDLFNSSFGQNLNQFQRQETEIDRHRASVAYTEPLSKKWFVTGSVNLNIENNQPSRKFYDRLSGERFFNDSLSSSFKRELVEQQASLSVRRTFEGLTFNFGASTSEIQLNTNQSKGNFNYFFPFANLRYRLKGSKSIRLAYSTSVNNPELNQLVSIPNNANPNSFYIGNPNLKPEYQHSLNLNYFNFDPKSRASMWAGINARKYANKIVNRTQVNSDFTRTIQPQNTDFYESINAYGNINRKIKKLGIDFSLGSNITYSNYEVFLNESISKVQGEVYSFNSRIGRTKNEKWDLNVGFNYSINEQAYSLNSDFNQRFDNSGWFANAELQLLKHLRLSTVYKIERYNAANFSSGRTLHLINASLQQSFKDEEWIIYLIANDLLNQNRGIMRSGDVNSLRDESFNTRAQYFMLAVSKKFGKRKEQKSRWMR